MARTIDLNSDLGEGFGPWQMGDDAQMLGIVTSANIACGGHAGDPETLFSTLKSAKENGVVVGAHPGYADLPGFGRRVIPMATEEISRMVAYQLGAFLGVAALAGVTVAYVKPHGALANVAADDPGVARAILSAIRAVDARLAVLAISGTTLEVEALRADFTVFSEVFADRGYLSTGRLVPRSQPGAMIHDPQIATDRLIGLLTTGRMPTIDGLSIPLRAHSICVHGDSGGAVAMARRIRTGLTAAGWEVKAFAD